jgi:hypothetical protein
VTDIEPTPAKLTEAQEEWVVRMCKAMLMWSQKARGLYTIGIGTDTQEYFTPRQLANRFLKEMGIDASFPEPEPTRRK